MSNKPKIKQKGKKKKVKQPPKRIQEGKYPKAVLEAPLSLVGTGHGHQLAPTRGEVWVLNDLGCHIYCTMLWDVHNFDWTLQENYENYSHIQEDLTEEERWQRTHNRDDRFRRIEKFCRASGVPVMSVKQYDHTPSIAYPLDKVIDFFPGCREFLNSALSHGIAYALYCGFKSINLFGINVEMGTEWIYQRDCVSYWIGRGHGMGARITITGSPRRPMRIIDRKIYGFDRIQKDCGIEKLVRLPGPVPRPVKVVDESGEEW